MSYASYEANDKVIFQHYLANLWISAAQWLTIPQIYCTIKLITPGPFLYLRINFQHGINQR